MPTQHRRRSVAPSPSSAPTLSQLYLWLKDFDRLALTEHDRADLAMLTDACPDLSARNCALLWMQLRQRAMPVGPVRGFRAWERLDRCIERGSKALYIIAPCRRRTRDESDGDAAATDDTDSALHFKPSAVFASAQTVAASPSDGEVASTPNNEDSVIAKEDAEEAIYQCWECGQLLTAEQTVAGGTANYCLECAAQIPQLS